MRSTRTLFHVLSTIFWKGPSHTCPPRQAVVTKSGGASPIDLISRIVTLVLTYADNSALLAPKEIMVVGRPTSALQLPGKELLVTDTYKYWGSFSADEVDE
eukprot:364199-Chlamydomonas_euryale.AAC.4